MLKMHVLGGESAKGYSSYQKKLWRFLKILHSHFWVHVQNKWNQGLEGIPHMAMFTAALFTMATRCKPTTMSIDC